MTLEQLEAGLEAQDEEIHNIFSDTVRDEMFNLQIALIKLRVSNRKCIKLVQRLRKMEG